MFTRVVIENFKSLKRVDLTLGQLNVFIGTNASGKSNFFDALRVLQGIGNGFTISEILDGKPKSATSEVWEGIRGGSAKARFDGESHPEISFSVGGKLASRGTDWTYKIGFTPVDGRVSSESLSVGGYGSIFDSESIGVRPADIPALKVRYYRGTKGNPPHLTFDSSRPALVQFARGGEGKWKKEHAEIASEVAKLLSNMQRIDPSPSVLRTYSQAHQIERMGDRGENFAALIRKISGDASAKDAYLSWLKQLRPSELDDVGTLSGAVGEPLFMLVEGGREYPAPVLSDGTLRFAAITAAFFQPDMPTTMTIEEIENGIHASRVRLLVELLRSRAAHGQTQVIATTHSPIVLAWLHQEEYRTTFFCKRDESTGESKICPLPELPHFLDVVQKQPISDLFSEGWLENSL